MPLGDTVPTNDLMNLYIHGIYMLNLCLVNNGVGLSAVQVGIPWNFFVTKDGPNGRFFVNCSYEGIGEKDQDSIEGCLSLKDAKNQTRFFMAKRFSKIKLTGHELLLQKDPQFILKDINLVVEGQSGLIYQHEIDHAQGITIDKIGKEVFFY